MKSVAVQTQDEPAPSPTLAPSLPALEAPDLRSSFMDHITNRGINSDADAYVDRLTFLGMQILNFCVAASLFDNHDITTTDDLQVRTRRLLPRCHSAG